MLVHPLPGTNRVQLRDTLANISQKLGNLRGGASPTWEERLFQYLDWADEAARQLSHVVRAEDIERLVLTRRYYVLLNMVGVAGSRSDVGRVVNGLLNLEMDTQVRAFEQAQEALRRVISRWSSLAMFMAFDTNVFMRHPVKFLEIDFEALIAEAGAQHELAQGGGRIHLLLPAVVVAELDRLKEAKSRDHQRWRCGYTLAVLDKTFTDPTAPAALPLPEDATAPRPSEVTVELLIDPIGHVPLPVNDDEIIDRLLAAQDLAARKITLVTYDTHMSTKARKEGLAVIKLDIEIGDEPARR